MSNEDSKQAKNSLQNRVVDSETSTNNIQSEKFDELNEVAGGGFLFNRGESIKEGLRGFTKTCDKAKQDLTKGVSEFVKATPPAGEVIKMAKQKFLLRRRKGEKRNRVSSCSDLYFGSCRKCFCSS